MKIINKKVVVWLPLAIFIFLIGAALGANYSIVREMQINEKILVSNASILASCDMNKCRKEIVKAIIQQNNIAVNNYVALEKDLQGGVLSKIGYGVWPLIYFLYEKPERITPSSNLYEYYRKFDS